MTPNARQITERCSLSRVAREAVPWTHKQHLISDFGKRQVLRLNERLEPERMDWWRPRFAGLQAPACPDASRSCPG